MTKARDAERLRRTRSAKPPPKREKCANGPGSVGSSGKLLAHITAGFTHLGERSVGNSCPKPPQQLPKLPSGAVFFFPLLSGRRRRAVKLPQSPNTYTSAAQHSSEEPRTSRQHNKFSALVANSVRGWLLPVHLPLFFSSPKNHSLLRDSVLFFFIFVPSILDLFVSRLVSPGLGSDSDASLSFSTVLYTHDTACT